MLQIMKERLAEAGEVFLFGVKLCGFPPTSVLFYFWDLAVVVTLLVVGFSTVYAVLQE